jgi:pimeloyl-ACP methyl ester carboxylesterase
MNPFFFGSTGRRLFGIYEPAAPATSGKRAAILCYPTGAEYVYAHRTTRQLALKLSNAGFHTLRFDYYGTGDSGGELTDVTLVDWEADLKTAIDELIEITGLTKVTLIGMRLGGTIAAAVASQLRSVIEALALWDPVVSGPEFLQQLGVSPNNKSPLESQDLQLSERMLREIGNLDLSRLILQHHPRTLILVTEELPSRRQLMLSIGELEMISMEFLVDVHPWLEKSFDSGMVPSSVLQRILNWLK